MEKAIQKAIEGGYEPFLTFHMEYAKETHYFSLWMIVVPGSGGTAQKNYSDIFLDTKFWQSLGKAIGHGKGVRVELGGGFWTEDMWEEDWRRFIDWLIADKSPKEFFTSLLA